jgi:hypothetical protein
MSLHLGYRKQFWFVLALLAAQVALPPARTPVSQPLTAGAPRRPVLR